MQTYSLTALYVEAISEKSFRFNVQTRHGSNYIRWIVNALYPVLISTYYILCNIFFFCTVEFILSPFNFFWWFKFSKICTKNSIYKIELMTFRNFKRLYFLLRFLIIDSCFNFFFMRGNWLTGWKSILLFKRI